MPKRRSDKPLLTAADKERYTKNPLTLWRWRATPGACIDCTARDGRKYFYNDIPDRPHPNCKCMVIPINEGQIRSNIKQNATNQKEGPFWTHPDSMPTGPLLPRYIYGDLDGSFGAMETFDGSNSIKITFTSLISAEKFTGIAFPCVYVNVYAGGVHKEERQTGHLIPSSPHVMTITIPFLSEFNWRVDMHEMCSENGKVFYEIQY